MKCNKGMRHTWLGGAGRVESERGESFSFGMKVIFSGFQVFPSLSAAIRRMKFEKREMGINHKV
jgi:hypothetical protein